MAGSAPYYWKARKGWYVNVVVDGKRQKRFLAETKREALEEYKQLFLTPNPSGHLFLEVGAAWLKHQLWRAKQGEVSSSYVKRVSRTVEAFGRTYPDTLASEVTERLVYDWLGDVSSGYVRTEMTTLRQCLRWAVRSKMITANGLEGVRLPPGGTRNKILSPAEHHALCLKAHADALEICLDDRLPALGIARTAVVASVGRLFVGGNAG